MDITLGLILYCNVKKVHQIHFKGNDDYRLVLKFQIKMTKIGFELKAT